MTKYEPAPFACGHCRKPLDFMVIKWPVPGAWYVHRDDHRYHCNGRRLFGPHTASHGMTMRWEHES